MVKLRAPRIPDYRHPLPTHKQSHARALMREGYSNSLIADRLNCSYPSVQKFLKGMDRRKDTDNNPRFNKRGLNKLADCRYDPELTAKIEACWYDYEYDKTQLWENFDICVTTLKSWLIRLHGHYITKHAYRRGERYKDAEL